MKPDKETDSKKIIFKKRFLKCSISRLALYVYEYLLHVGAQKAAQTFLNEVSTQKDDDSIHFYILRRKGVLMQNLAINISGFELKT